MRKASADFSSDQIFLVEYLIEEMKFFNELIHNDERKASVNYFL
jgi:hypothetical protein